MYAVGAFNFFLLAEGVSTTLLHTTFIRYNKVGDD